MFPDANSTKVKGSKLQRPVPPHPLPPDIIGHSQLKFCPKAIMVKSKKGKPFRAICESAACSQECHLKWARRVAAALSLSWKKKPPHLFLRLTAKGLTDPETTAAEKKFLRAIKRWGCEYVCFREWLKPGKGRHLHIAVSLHPGVKLSKLRVRKLWQHCVPKESRIPIYSANVENLVGLAKYLPKAVKRHHCLPPRWFGGRVFFRSRGALLAPVAELWQEQIKQWYPTQ